MLDFEAPALIKVKTFIKKSPTVRASRLSFGLIKVICLHDNVFKGLDVVDETTGSVEMTISKRYEKAELIKNTIIKCICISNKNDILRLSAQVFLW